MRRFTPLLLVPGLLVLLALAACVSDATSTARVRVIALIGGAGTEGPGKHAYAQGIALLADALREANADGVHPRLELRSFPDGWPSEARGLDGVDAIVLYCDGLDRHPLADPMHRRQFDAMMRHGVGLVALHQASTVAPEDDFGLQHWLGAVRRGLVDRSTETTTLQPVAPMHPALSGVQAFRLRDEFYPTLALVPSGFRLTPLLEAELHPQYRNGASLLRNDSERRMVAWAFERDDGGRAIGYTGAHFLAALEQPALRDFLVRAVTWSAHAALPPVHAVQAGALIAAATPTQREPKAGVQHAVATFHHDRGRSGWIADGSAPPRSVVGPRFGQVWESPSLDGDDGEPARLYASPLFVADVEMRGGPQQFERLSLVIAASNLGEVVAINAHRVGDLAPGRILWRRRLGAPCRLQPAPLDGVPTGILSTPIVDRDAGRIYVTHCDPDQRWQAYALDLSTGAILRGWPVRLDERTLNAVNANAGPEPVPPKRRFDFRVQRAALNLSPDGGSLYIAFGESETGWLVAVDTGTPRVSGAYASVAMPHRGSGGIWGAGGPAVDADGNVYVVTGTGFGGYLAQDHDWTQSLLKLSDLGGGPFVLRGSYTPFNHCLTAAADIDLGSGGASLAPADGSSSPRLLVIGGKQGNAYLLDRDRLPGQLDRRPACTGDASADGSLLAPQIQPQFGTRGPLNVFGPYSERDAAMDIARARSVPAWFRDARGVVSVFFTGTSKEGEGSAVSVPPSIVRLEVSTSKSTHAWLRAAASDNAHAFGNPGSPVVTSLGADEAVVWVLDENAPRSSPLVGEAAPGPVLYALDPADLRELWRSIPGGLATSGKYNAPAFGDGLVFVGTNRIQAFGANANANAVASPHRVAASPPLSLPPPAAPIVPGVVKTAGASEIFRQRCAACHDNAQGNIPPRSVLAGYTRERIIAALTVGVMRPHALGLDAAQIAALADYLR